VHTVQPDSTIEKCWPGSRLEQTPRFSRSRAPHVTGPPDRQAAPFGV